MAMRHRMFFLFCIVSWLLPSIVFAEEDILIVTEEWAPYNYTENGEITGLSTDIVKHILGMLNKHYDIEILPSMRSSYVLDNRPHTMMFSMFRTSGREAQYQWIGPLCDGKIYFYKKKDAQIKIENLDDLRDTRLSICSRQGGLIHTLLIEQGFGNLDDAATNGLQVYKKLLAGRCDIAISETDLGVRYILNSIGLTMDDMLEKIPFPIYESELYIVGTKDIPAEEIQQWQSALDTMKANGVYEEIIQKYDCQEGNSGSIHH